MPPFNFDEEYSQDDDQDDAEEAFAQVADRAVAEALGPELEDDEDDDSYMNEVDKRLEVTTYYRAFLDGEMFSRKTEATNVVEKEIRKFVMKRIRLLLGMDKPEEKEPPKVVSPFSEDEITALKMFAARLLASPALVKPEPKTEQRPEIVKVTAPEQKPAVTLNKRTVQTAPVVTKLDVKPPAVDTRPTVQVKAKEQSAPAKTKKKTPAPKSEDPESPLQLEKKVIHPDTGEEVTIKVQKVQRPEGRLPFPTTALEMDALTSVAANQAIAATATNYENLISRK